MSSRNNTGRSIHLQGLVTKLRSDYASFRASFAHLSEQHLAEQHLSEHVSTHPVGGLLAACER